MITPHNKVYCCDSSFMKGLTELMQPSFESLLGPICLPLVDRFIQLLKVAQASSGWVDVLYPFVYCIFLLTIQMLDLLPSEWAMFLLRQIDNELMNNLAWPTLCTNAALCWMFRKGIARVLQGHRNKCKDLSQSANVKLFLSSQYFRESILNDIRKARTLYTGKELAAELARIRQRVDNIEVLSADIVINLLLSYRDIQVCILCSKIT